MIQITASFLVVALSAYVLFGGADFGGGILESTLPTQALKQRLQKTLAPVWEANHVWLIAVIVILFVGFPHFHVQVMTRLYIPVSVSLFAILIRGAFFTLRKYDPNPGPLSRIYTAAFRASSALAPFSFGILVAGLLAQHPNLENRELTFTDVYVSPWFDWFALVCGAYVAALFGYVASVFFYGELSDPVERDIVAARIGRFFVVTFLLGGSVLLLGYLSGRVSIAQAMQPFQWLSHAVAFIFVFVLYRALRRGQFWRMRLAVGAQVLAILAGWFHAQYPALLRFESGVLTLEEAAAPPITLMWLNIGLVVVLSAVIPLLVLLYRVFESKDDEPASFGS